MTTLEEQRDWLSGFPNSSTFDAKSDMVKISAARTLLTRTTRCMLAYKRELDGFATTASASSKSGSTLFYIRIIYSDHSKKHYGSHGNRTTAA